MRLYKCSNCGKQVIPEGFRKMGMLPTVNPKRFCCCKIPDITESKIQFDKEAKLIAQAITDSLPTKEEIKKWMEKDGVKFPTHPVVILSKRKKNE